MSLLKIENLNFEEIQLLKRSIYIPPNVISKQLDLGGVIETTKLQRVSFKIEEEIF